MGDHFVLMVDRLLTESTLEAAIGRGDAIQATDLAVEVEMETGDLESVECDSSERKGRVVECRICQDEGGDCDMETPCSCSGSLKYAHRKCVQRWCNEKGDTTCEICLQPFEPGYSSPPKLYHQGHAPMGFRGNWEVSRQDHNNSHVLTMFPRDGGGDGYSDGYQDDYGAPSEKNLMLCRAVAVIFMMLIFLRHVLPIILSEEEYILEEFSLLAMRVAGVFFPIYVIIHTLPVLYFRRRFQNLQLPVAAPEGGNERWNVVAQA